MSVAFLLAVVAVQLTPGPDMMLVVARGVGQGRRVALYSVAGISAAGLIQIPGLALGVSALFEESAYAYAVLQNVGAVYLLWLGARFILGSSHAGKPTTARLYSARAAFYQGLWSNLSNPKSWVFLLAFLPQFVSPSHGNVPMQLALLGVTHKAIGLVVDASVAITAGTTGDWLRRNSWVTKWQERFVGGVLLAVGLRLALDGRADP